MWTFQTATDNKYLDSVDWHILEELQTDARLSFAELGRRVGLSSPAAQERVRKLEDAGVITGYRAEIDVTKLGLPIMAMIRVSNNAQKERHILAMVQDTPEVLECHHVTGADCFYIRIAVSSIPHLERVLTQFQEYNQTITSIVLSTPLKNRIVTERIHDAMRDG